MQNHSTLTDRIASRLWLGIFIVYTAAFVALVAGFAAGSL
jgi:hypothetical protein